MNFLKNLTDAQLAHAFARIGLGINIALHGWTRIPKMAEFQEFLTKKFEGSFLPSSLVTGMSYGIVTAESIIGALLLIGWQLRATLIAGHLLMFTLLFGVCLVQDWSAAGSQLIYLAFFSVLLATRKYSALGKDGREA